MGSRRSRFATTVHLDFSRLQGFRSYESFQAQLEGCICAGCMRLPQRSLCRRRCGLFGFEEAEAPSAAAAKLVRSAARMCGRPEDAQQSAAQGVIRVALVFDESARRFTQFALVP